MTMCIVLSLQQVVISHFYNLVEIVEMRKYKQYEESAMLCFR